jgi:hypothetical protein
LPLAPVPAPPVLVVGAPGGDLPGIPGLTAALDAAMTRFAIATARINTMSTKCGVGHERGNGALTRTMITLRVRVVGMGHCLDGPHLGHVGAEATITHGRRAS